MNDALTRLAATVATMPAVARNASGHQHRYLDLPGLIAHVTPQLAAHGLAAVTEATKDDDGRVGVRALFVGPDDVYETPWFWLPPARTPQDAGGAVTYARRYVLSCALGLPEVDHVSENPPAPAKPKPKRNAGVQRLQILFKEAGITDRDERLRIASDVAGRAVESANDLQPREIQALTKHLEAISG